MSCDFCRALRGTGAPLGARVVSSFTDENSLLKRGES